MNGQSVENLSVGEVLRLVEEGGDHVVFSVLKYAPTPQPSLVSSSASSGQILTESSPEAPSTSPRSPRSRLWVNTSPDSNKPITIKSSGSQTDSLDSPPTVSRTCNGTTHPENDRAYIKMIENLFPSDRERERARERDRERNSHSVSGHMMMLNAASDRRTDDEAVGVINEINAIIKQQQSKTPLVPSSTDKRSRREKEMENGGTWPKCRTNFDFPTANGPGGFNVLIPNKERPPLSNIITDTQYLASASPVASPASQSSSSSGEKVPPTPPVRKDSFNRGASIKHSPQNSDSSVKYNHMNNMVPMSKTSKSSSYLTSSPSKQPASHPMGSLSHSAAPQPMELQSKTSVTGLGERERDRERDRERETERDSRERESRERDREAHKPQSMVNYDKHSMHFPHSSTPDSGSFIPLDNTVVSAKLDAHDQLHYILHSRPSRPTSAPSRGRKERREMANMVHSAGPHKPIAQKPNTLPIQPIYSPRPLPQSGGQHIVPSQPHLPRDTPGKPPSTSG